MMLNDIRKKRRKEGEEEKEEENRQTDRQTDQETKNASKESVEKLRGYFLPNQVCIFILRTT